MCAHMWAPICVYVCGQLWLAEEGIPYRTLLMKGHREMEK